MGRMRKMRNRLIGLHAYEKRMEGVGRKDTNFKDVYIHKV